MTTFNLGNLTADAVDTIWHADLPKSVRLAFKFISEDKSTTPEEVSRNCLEKAIKFLMEEYGWILKTANVKIQVPSEENTLANANHPETFDFDENHVVIHEENVEPLPLIKEEGEREVSHENLKVETEDAEEVTIKK